MRVIGIVGSRRRDADKDFDICEKVFAQYYEFGDTLVSGGCPMGADRFAEIIAKKYSIPIKIYPADWKKYGKRAGFLRNTNIAEDADILIALCAPDRKGGTEDTVRKASHMRKKVIIT